MDKTKAIIEGILFAKGEPVEIEDIASALEIEKDEAVKLTLELAEEYAQEGRGMNIIRLEDAFQMCTNKTVYEALIKIVSRPHHYRLTDVMLETLSIVAYMQPVTRIEIENIRGVSSDHAVNKLIEYGLIEEAGRRRAPGRPQTFRTTDEFLRRFQLSGKDDLPTVNPEILDEIRREVADETGFYDEDPQQEELDLSDPSKADMRAEAEEQIIAETPEQTDNTEIKVEI